MLEADDDHGGVTGMEFYKLSDASQRAFAAAPEHFMGVQLAQSESGEIWLVIGGQVAVVWAGVPDTAEPFNDRNGWREPSNRSTAMNFKRWRDELREVSDLRFWEGASVSAFIIYAGPVLSWPFPHPAPPYGHLPHTGSTQAGDVYFRYEPYPVSRRLVGNTIAAGTFAVPLSEYPFIPTGFSAVGRYALPALSSAKYRWTIVPEAKTRLAVGASVPLYGQAGGGVEVKFMDPSKNTFHFVAPVVLPDL